MINNGKARKFTLPRPVTHAKLSTFKVVWKCGHNWSKLASIMTETEIICQNYDSQVMKVLPPPWI